MKKTASLNLNQFRALKHGNYICQVASFLPLGNNSLQTFLKLPDNFPHYQAGQYIELVLPDGTSRPYSIANFDPEHRYIELHIDINPNSQATLAIIDQLRHNKQITVKSAKGDVSLKSTTSPQVFLAAGSGFSQIKSLMQHFIDGHKQGSTKTPFYLIWGTDTPEQRYMIDLIKAWLSQYDNLIYRPLSWQKDHCWESALAPLMDNLAEGQFYLCGSPNRVYRTLDFLEQHGINETQVHSDVFSYAPRPVNQHTG